MKKILYFLPLLLLFISCQTTEYITSSINTDEPLKNSFVSKLNPNKSLSGDDIINKIKKEAGLNNEEELKNITLRKLTNIEKSKEDSLKVLYVLHAKTDKGVSLAHIFSTNSDNTSLISEDRTCKCTSTNCSHGCNAEIFGGNCSCSHCSQECKKESIVSEEFEL